MKTFQIVSVEYIPLMLRLAEGFRVSFGTLQNLVRVLVRIHVQAPGGEIVEGIGEAAIDFPFSRYDMYDVYHALVSTPLQGQRFEDRAEFLSHLTQRYPLLADVPAAMCALNQALDQVVAAAAGLPADQFYGCIRPQPMAMESLGITNDVQCLRRQILNVVASGRTPKPKVGAGAELDLQTIAVVEQMAVERGFRYMLDFNAGYTVAAFGLFMERLASAGAAPRHALAIEQPTETGAGVQGLAAAASICREMSLRAALIADESFVTPEDALRCAERGIGLNFKLQKVGGILASRAIEQRVQAECKTVVPGMVGGTFPTAIGRAYDRMATRVLRTAFLPSDGALPASSYFSGEQDLLVAEPRAGSDGASDQPTKRPNGMITVNMAKVQRLRIPDMERLFEAIRNGTAQQQSRPDMDHSYAAMYEHKTGRNTSWNLKTVTPRAA